MTYPLQDGFARALRPRIGLQTNLAGPPTNWAFVPYELAYTTDSKTLYIFDATGANPVPVNSSIGTFIVSALPAGMPAGTRAFVSDATAPSFTAALTGGGGVFCPVYFDGTIWRAG